MSRLQEAEVIFDTDLKLGITGPTPDSALE